ncbi:MAG: acyl-CoA dehydrogenase family protein [Chloroflexota bacterium]|nr:acyl-CoA dehydrogenase family protein [Chloroflexota bacterium]
MYSFDPSDEQKMLVDAVRRYAQSDLRSKAHEAEEECQLPTSLIEKGWELGILQASFPEECGGFGEHSAVTGVLAAEEMAWGDMAGALAVMNPGLFALPIMLAGSNEQKQQYLPDICQSEWKPYTAALIEPHFDFDPNELRTTATVKDGGYLLSGTKTYVPYAGNNECMIVYANLDGSTQGFILPKDTPGVLIGERQKVMGINALPLYQVDLQDVFLPAGNHLNGLDGQGFAPILDAMRVAMAAIAVGLSRAALEYAIDYAKDREVFGVKVAQKQAIAFMIAEMATEVEAIRLLTWEAAWMLDNGREDASVSAYLALTGATDMAMMVTDRAVQVLGGHGYIREHPVELWMRNGRGIAMLNGLAMV